VKNKWFFAFLVLVWRMRFHQDAWFRLHKQSDLYEAKKYERMVDGWFRENVLFEKGAPVRLIEKVEQVNLFTEDGDEADKNQ
jgi:hypothetical protein